MNPTDYIKNTAVTDHDDLGYEVMSERCGKQSRLVHYLLGIGTEAGELQDQLKKHLAYGKPFDEVNIKEELGDLMWYVARTCDTLGLTLEEVMEVNINKLKARYGDKFTAYAALNRDLENERKVLENK